MSINVGGWKIAARVFQLPGCGPAACYRPDCAADVGALLARAQVGAAAAGHRQP